MKNNDQEQAEILTKVSGTNETLANLDLEENNNIGYSGAKALLEALEVNITVSFGGNEIVVNEGEKFLSEALWANKNITNRSFLANEIKPTSFEERLDEEDKVRDVGK